MLPIKTHKMAIVGNSGVGKSSILLRLCKNYFSDSESATIGASFVKYQTEMDGVHLRFDIWDTAGQERYRSLLPLYIRNTNVVLAVYDINDTQSLHDLNEHWLPIIKEQLHNEDFHLYIIGNKFDLITKPDNITECTDYSMSLTKKFKTHTSTCFVSAKTGLGIEELIYNICRNSIDLKLDTRPFFNYIMDLNDDVKKENNECCDSYMIPNISPYVYITSAKK